MQPNPFQKRAGRKARRREILHRLAAAGLSRGRFPRAVRADESTPAEVRLQGVLGELGGVFVAWGRYLSSRFDLLPGQALRHLAGLPDRRPPAAGSEICHIIEEELGRPVGETYATFDRSPAVSSWLYQEHLARTPDGSPAVVRVVQPAMLSELDRDMEHLPALDRALEECGATAAGLDAARSDFAASTRAALDLRDVEEVLAGARGEPAPGHFQLPRTDSDRSAARVLTFERVQGLTLEAFVPATATGVEGTPALGRPASEQLASRLCQAWLELALGAGIVAYELRPEDVWVLPEQRIVWTGSEATRLAAASRENLWEYVTASASQDPDRACAALLREMDGGDGDLKRSLRQLIPFRDGGAETRDDLAGHLCLHWRLAVQAGYRPRPGLIAFYRGLQRLTLRGRQLAPGGDPLRAGLEAAQLVRGMGEWTRLIDPVAARALAGGSLAALLTLPQKLDEVLTLASEGKAAVKLQMVESPSARRRRDASASVIAALLALIAVLLLSRHFASVGLPEARVEPVTTVLVIILGFYALRGAGRWK